MTVDEYIEQRSRRSWGILGPLGEPQVYRITIARPARPGPARQRERFTDDPLTRHRFEAHRKAAEADRAVAQLRARSQAAPARRGDSPEEFRRQLRLRGAR